MPPVTNCASYTGIEAQFVTVKGIINDMKHGASPEYCVAGGWT